MEAAPGPKRWEAENPKTTIETIIAAMYTQQNLTINNICTKLEEAIHQVALRGLVTQIKKF